jgi:hypothetical protein
MNLLRRFYALGGAVFVGGEASAGVLRVSVGFSTVDGVAAVPLSPWAMGLMGFLMALLAWRRLRQKSSCRSWPLVLLASLGLMFFGASKPWMPEAVAIDASSFNLVFPSPTISPDLRLGFDISAVNVTGQTIRIDDVAGPKDNSFLYLGTPTRSPICQQGLILAPNAICFVRIAPYP